ncbi:MAG: PhoH family protein [Bacteroidales bacterium]|jgi:phosphate starvation-inducible PhoH-like protein
MEKTIIIDPTIVLSIFGRNNAHINLLSEIYPKIKITARGNEIKLIGEEKEIENVEKKIELLIIHFEKFGTINENDILNITSSDEYAFYQFDKNSIVDDVILHGREGRLIKAITPNQKRMVESSQVNDIVFAIGPAGTGKTYTAVALAVRALKNKQIRRIILTRPAVEAGENLGFLPGDLRDKLDPYLQPLYDALWDMMPMSKLLSYIEDKTIEIAPLAFMRGRTLDNAYVILDEAQNATEGQIKMFLTRMGKNAKLFITGDLTQIDLPRNQQSGLVKACKILENIKGIDFIFMKKVDVVRHPLVTKIIDAFEEWSHKEEKKEDQ